MYIFSIASIVTFFKYYLVLKIFICNALTNSVFFDIILMCVMTYWKEEYLLGRAVMVTSFKGGVGKNNSVRKSCHVAGADGFSRYRGRLRP